VVLSRLLSALRNLIAWTRSERRYAGSRTCRWELVLRTDSTFRLSLALGSVWRWDAVGTWSEPARDGGSVVHLLVSDSRRSNTGSAMTARVTRDRVILDLGADTAPALKARDADGNRITLLELPRD